MGQGVPEVDEYRGISIFIGNGVAPSPALHDVRAVSTHQEVIPAAAANNVVRVIADKDVIIIGAGKALHVDQGVLAISRRGIDFFTARAVCDNIAIIEFMIDDSKGVVSIID